MSQLPSLVKILRYLRSSGTSKTYAEIIRAVGESQEFVDRALAKLVKEGIVTEKGGLYYYRATYEAEEFCRKMFTIYDEVVRREQQ